MRFSMIQKLKPFSQFVIWYSCFVDCHSMFSIHKSENHDLFLTQYKFLLTAFGEHSGMQYP